MARTAAIGFRREPHPPMPMVSPLASSPTSSSSESRLSATVPVRPLLGGVGVAFFHERRPLLVGHPGDVELVGEPLLEAVAEFDVHRVDAVERLLGTSQDGGALGRD